MSLTLPDISEIQTLVGHELDDQEKALANLLIGSALTLLRARIPGLDEKVSTGAVDPELVSMVIASAVARVLKNPDGWYSQTMGPFTGTMSTKAASGYLSILPEEWKLFGVGGAATYVAPATDGYAAGKGWNPASAFQFDWPARSQVSQRWDW